MFNYIYYSQTSEEQRNCRHGSVARLALALEWHVSWLLPGDADHTGHDTNPPTCMYPVKSSKKTDYLLLKGKSFEPQPIRKHTKNDRAKRKGR